LNEQWLFVQHGCQCGLTTVLTTAWMFVYTIQPVVSCKRSSDGHVPPSRAVEQLNVILIPVGLTTTVESRDMGRQDGPTTASLPAALRAAQTCRYLVYSWADFEVFRPAGATRCTGGGEIWHGGGDLSLHAKFHPHRCNDKDVGPPKLKFLLRFDRNVDYKRPLRNFHKICTVCTSF